MLPLNCATGELLVYSPTSQKPWDRRRAMHLLRRIGMGASPQNIDAAIQESPEAVVNNLLSQATSLPLAPEPEWAYWQIADYSPIEAERNQQIVEQVLAWATQWLKDIKNNGLRDRMSWFWHNHFVTRLDDYGCPSWMYQYHKLLQEHALGNFKVFTREMGITPAMLIFLNGVQNTQFDPNENFARELYELFTLGLDNGYTQNDIVETARAVTGWSGLDIQNLCGEVEFVPAFWDAGEKTIFGQTGNWDYDDVIDILFEQRATEISEFICGKLYRHFVNPKEDENVIADLAQIMRDADWQIAPVMQAIFLSEHFFDDANVGTVIPGHIEYFLTFLNELDYPDEDDIILALGFSAGEYDQAIFNPTNVAGWPGNRNWISTGSLNFRWKGINDAMGYYFAFQGESIEHLRTWAINLLSPFEGDPALVTNTIVDFLLPNGLQKPADYADALAAFKSEVPENYFENGEWNLSWEYAPYQLFLLINHIANIPEFQLR